MIALRTFRLAYVITLEDSRLSCGGGIQIGNKFTRCRGHHGKPDLHTAIMKSCDGYFYRLGLKMGLAGIMAMVDELKLNKRTGIDLPHELTSWTPSPEFKAPRWTDIDTEIKQRNRLRRIPELPVLCVLLCGKAP